MSNVIETSEKKRSLIVFSDGTGNKGGVTHDTNVWRLYQMIDRSEGNQCTFYDDGVGTQSFAPLKAISGAFGWGLSRNIREAYTFLAKNHSFSRGDYIYFFGFSRGAFTVRALLGFINKCGLVDTAGKTSDVIKAEVATAFEAFRSKDPSKAEALNNEHPNIEFIGVWDTVDAVGLPMDELLHLLEPCYEMLTGKNAYRFTDLSVSGVKYARQALAIDDERRTFHPNVWREAGRVNSNEDSRVDVDQVWFSGMHSNVGGSYPKDGLAYITLEWMLMELQKTNEGDGKIKLRAESIKEVSNLANQADKLYDSRSGLAAYYRYSPRDVELLSSIEGEAFLRRLSRNDEKSLPIKIHASVIDRIRQGVGNYAPLFLPLKEIKLGFTDSEKSRWAKIRYKGLSFAEPDEKEQEEEEKERLQLKKLVRRRQYAFYAYLSATIVLILFGLFKTSEQEFGTVSVCRRKCEELGESYWDAFVPWLADTLKSLLPKMAEGLVDNIFTHWPISLTMVFLAVGCYISSKVLQRKINRLSRKSWDSKISRAPVSQEPPG